MMCLPSAISSWTATIVVGADTDSYAGSAAADVVTAMTDLVEWANEPARPWSASFSWAWVVGAGGSVRVRLDATSTFRFSAVSANDLGFVTAGSPATESVATADAPGCWGCLSTDRRGRLSVRLAYRFLPAAGDGSGVGAVRSGVPGTASIRPTIEAATDAAGLAGLDALLRPQSGDRTCMVWDSVSRDWLNLRLGPVTRSPAGRSLYRLTFDTRGV